MSEIEWVRLTIGGMGITITALAGFIMKVLNDKATDSKNYATELKDLTVRVVEALIKNTDAMNSSTEVNKRLLDQIGKRK